MPAVDGFAAFVEDDDEHRAGAWRGAPRPPGPCGRRRSPARLSANSRSAKEGQAGARPRRRDRNSARPASRSGPGLQPADGRDRDLHRTAAVTRRRRRGARLRSATGRRSAVLGQPHLLDIVESPDFRPEDVDDDIAGVDQHPIAVLEAFDAEIAAPASLRSPISRSAIAPTWRCERPEATIMKSASGDFPVMSMETGSSALASSRLAEDHFQGVRRCEFTACGR